MFKKIAATVLAVCLTASAARPAYAAGTDYGFDLETLSGSVLLMSLDTGEVIYEKNADAVVAPASTTKIMSAALAMEMCPDLDGTIVTVPDDIWAEFEGLNVSTAGLVPGENLTMHELIYCMMLQSANEAASTVARYFGWDEFIAAMNRKAVQLGCSSTKFSDPHGVFSMSNGGNATTARDLAKIAAWALTVPGFWEITCEYRHYKEETDKNAGVWLTSTILMQNPNTGYYTPYIRGIKTGTTDEAGRCLVTAAQKDGETYLLVLLGAPFEYSPLVWEQGNSVYTDARRIFDWAFDNLEVRNVVDTGTIAAEVKLRYASEKDTLLLYPDTALYTVVNKNEEQNDIEYVCTLPDEVKAPVVSGQVIGSAEVYRNGVPVGTTELVSRENVERSTFLMVMDNLSDILTSKAAVAVYAAIAALVAVYVYFALVVMPKRQKQRRRQALREAQRRVNSSHPSSAGGAIRVVTDEEIQAASHRGKKARSDAPRVHTKASGPARPTAKKKSGTRSAQPGASRTGGSHSPSGSRYGDRNIKF